MVISFTRYSAPQASCNSPSNSWSMILSFLNMFYDLVDVDEVGFCFVSFSYNGHGGSYNPRMKRLLCGLFKGIMESLISFEMQYTLSLYYPLNQSFNLIHPL